MAHLRLRWHALSGNDTTSASMTHGVHRPCAYSVALLIFLLCILSPQILSQTLPNIMAGDQLGELPYVSYHGGDIDAVSLTNGTLSLHIPIISYPQRGKLAVSFSLKYNNVLQHYGPLCVPPDPCELDWTSPYTRSPMFENSDVFASFDQALGLWVSTPYPRTWKVGGQTYTENYADYYVTTSDGAKHILGNLGSTSVVTWPSGGPTDYLVSSGPFETLDATGIMVNGTLAPTSALTQLTGIITPNGLIFGGNSVQDANGNYITLGATMTDTLGRSIPSPPTASSSSNTSTSACPSGPLPVIKAVAWNVPAMGGATATYTFCYVTVTPNMSNPLIIPSKPNNVTVNGGMAPTTNLQSVVLPNGTSWKFEYNDPDATFTNNGQPVTYGTLSKITLPTGGSISYTWTNAGHSLAAQNPNVCNTGGRYVASRTVTDLDGVPHTWTYNWSTGTVTDPLGNDTVHAFGLHGSGGCALYETQTTYYQGSSTGSNPTVLRTVKTGYQNSSTGNTFPNPILNVVPTTITTVEANNQTKETQKGYDSGFSYTDHFGATGSTGVYGRVISEQAYDYATTPPGALLRTTSTKYAWQSPNPNYAEYLSNNLLNLPYSIQVTGSGGNSAYTYYGYDEASLVSSGLGSGQQKQQGEAYPGNQTSVHRLETGTTIATANCGVTVSNSYEVSTKTFYDTGEIQKSTDACGDYSTYQYSSAYFGAFVTTATNMLGQSTTYAYDLNTGAVTSITDPNSQITTESYDVLARPTAVNYPDGGSTTLCYSDTTSGAGGTCPTSAPYQVNKTVAITSSKNETSTLVFDGLGRLSQTRLTSDPSGTDYTLTTYDANGRKSQVYNPTRCSSITSNCSNETTWGYATTNYDALSRVTSVVEQDGSTVGTSYASFPCTTVTDEIGNSRQSCVDGLGRMTSVTEDPGSSPHFNYLTTYGYDVLGNLTNVVQSANNSPNPRNRSFTYDSLSQLTSATNPESGTLSYAYDEDGNVVTKTAPSPNQLTGTATVTTTYAYDKLNRLTTKSYTDGYSSNPATAKAMFGYDGTALTGCTTAPPADTDSYPIGRRTSMCDGSGATKWTHDKMGRILQERRTIGAVSGDYDNENFNLDGSVATVTALGYPITYSYNNARQLLNVENSSDPFNFETSVTYTPPGEIASANLGGSSGQITISNAYNDRLQPILLSASTSSGPVFSECFDFHLSIAITLPSQCALTAYTTGDNGNVYTVANERTASRTQTFTYDSLNRIATGQSNGTQWGESYNIDAWGNLQAINPISGQTNHEGLSQTALQNNQLTGFTYDTAGNMTVNGSSGYFYDAENRLIATAGTSYIYDGDGNRVEKCTEGTTPGTCASGATGTMYWRGTSPDPQAETDLSGNVLENYIFLNGRRIARRDAGTAAVHFYFSDQVGSHGVVVNASGATCEQDIDYYPFGGQENDYCPNVAQHYKFTGKERDAESGLDNFGARYDSSALGRFMTPDWSAKPVTVPYAKFGDPQSLNLYSYVENGPVNRIDPDGHLWADPGKPGSPGCVNNDTSSCSFGGDQARQYAETVEDTQAANSNPAQNQTPAPQPAPTDPQTGKPTPPPVPVPGAPEGTGWKWNPDPQNPRGGTWGPDNWKGPNPPRGSWDPDGHWDVDKGDKSPRDHYDPKGNPITPGTAHPGNAPTTMMDRMKSITPGPILKWGTAGVVIYIIIDEGSRLYPPRNLVPVP
jgi:RHS repeat-associated protein